VKSHGTVLKKHKITAHPIRMLGHGKCHSTARTVTFSQSYEICSIDIVAHYVVVHMVLMLIIKTISLGLLCRKQGEVNYRRNISFNNTGR
jgi:hypothetical protein